MTSGLLGACKKKKCLAGWVFQSMHYGIFVPDSVHIKNYMSNVVGNNLLHNLSHPIPNSLTPVTVWLAVPISIL